MDVLKSYNKSVWKFRLEIYLLTISINIQPCMVLKFENYFRMSHLLVDANRFCVRSTLMNQNLLKNQTTRKIRL